MTEHVDNGDSAFIDDHRRNYALYVLQNRALPAISDSLKPAARRLLWTAKDGKKYKTMTLAGSTMSLHPHGIPDSVCNTLAAPYGNNVPLFKGEGAFGTLINPTAFGASRYTSVKVSDFTNDVMFCDIDLIPMIDNYDSTDTEPKHFLPIVPTVLVNGAEGIAVGFATQILPRSLSDVVDQQINCLSKKKVEEVCPHFEKTNSTAELIGSKWVFKGNYNQIDDDTIVINNIPYGQAHDNVINAIIKLIDKGIVSDYTDNSKDTISIEVQFCEPIQDDKYDILKKLNLLSQFSENINMLDFDHERVINLSFSEIIEQFTKWRLKFYKKRYEKMYKETEKDLQLAKDILLAINKNVGNAARKVVDKQELVELLKQLGVVNVDYVSSLPVYRFTQKEKEKCQENIKRLTDLMKQYEGIIKSESKQISIYKKELTAIRNKYC